MNTSLQMLYSAISLPAISIGETLSIVVISGFFSLLAMVSFTLYLSSKCKSDGTTSIIAITTCFLPTLLSSVFNVNLLTCILPTTIVSLQSSLFYTLTGWNFIHIGSQISIWAPYIIIVAALIEIPLFSILAVRAYCKHEVL